MSHLKISNVKIAGITSCVPKMIEENKELSFFKKGEAEKVIASTGIERRRIADVDTTSADLCYDAAEDLLMGLNWRRDEIDCLIFVTQTPDYILPSNACIMQGRRPKNGMLYIRYILWLSGLGLWNECCCFSFIIWVYEEALLLVGDTPTKFKSRNDKTAWPLFGDAGTATALEYSEESDDMFFTFATEGKSYRSIIVKDGGARNPVTENSLKEVVYGEGIARRPLDSEMDGMSVLHLG